MREHRRLHKCEIHAVCHCIGRIRLTPVDDPHVYDECKTVEGGLWPDGKVQ